MGIATHDYSSVPQIHPPFCNLSLSTKRRGGLYPGYARDKNTSAGLCAKNAGGAYARGGGGGGAYLRDTTVLDPLLFQNLSHIYQ